MSNSKIEEGIKRFLKYIKRMNALSDQQLEILLGIKIAEDPEYYTSVGVDIKGHINFIRNMATMNDDAIRKYLRDQVNVNRDPVWNELFEDAGKKKLIRDMSDFAKDYRKDPRTWVRKVA